MNFPWWYFFLITIPICALWSLFVLLWAIRRVDKIDNTYWQMMSDLHRSNVALRRGDHLTRNPDDHEPKTDSESPGC